LKSVKGIYYAPHPPLISIESRRKMGFSIDEMKETILDQMKFVDGRIKRMLDPSRLLIKYDNYYIRIYDKFVKGQMLKFPLEVQQGNLYVSWVPRLERLLPFERTKQVQIYNHEIVFDKEVIRTDVTSFGGIAILILNPNNEATTAKLISPDHEEKLATLKSGIMYLFTHPRPRSVVD